MERKKFSERAIRQLKFYVYLYIDPRDEKPFYIGKGTGNRCFSHISDRTESGKTKRIDEIYKLGKQPGIHILRYGLSEEEAFIVEASAIDLLGIKQLQNGVRGHGSRVGARASVEQLAATLDAKEVVVAEPTVLININQLFRYDMTAAELYDATRSAWKVSERRVRNAQYAMSVFKGVVREIYALTAWFPEGSTLRHDEPAREREIDLKRLEFVGTIADASMRRRYIGRSVLSYFPKGSQNPIKYVNC